MADVVLVQPFGRFEDCYQFGDGMVYVADIFRGQVCEGAERRAYWLATHGDRVHEDAGVITSVKNNLNEPRTAIGVSADRSKVIMLVVDGRQPSHSNGADYPEMGIMFKAMGAYNAINLDGGGSSTFVLQSASVSDGFAAKNSPSDKSPRAIPNGLAIVSK